MEREADVMILLCAVNATYQYPSLGLRSLWANMGPLQGVTQLVEFSIKRDPREIAEEVVSLKPQIVGFGVYIWNVEHLEAICRELRQRQPDLHIVFGGPEVSYEWETSQLNGLANVVIQGEGEEAFREHCRGFLSGDWREQGRTLVIKAPLVELASLEFPYRFYSDHDLKTRHVCVEASRGCPFKCQFCLSSLDTQVRKFPLTRFCSELVHLLERGARNFKFIDRTFNLSASTCEAILRLFLPWKDQGLFLHFEVVPDRMPQVVKDLVGQFPPGTIQFEIGIQTLNQEVAHRIQRFNDWERVKENLHFLVNHTSVHLHADLIAGLPGEDLESFARGFDRLLDLGPQEIQVGVLKRLRGAPIAIHDDEWGMVYHQKAPYQVLSTRHLSAEYVQSVERFAKYWERINNSGCFGQTLRLLWTWGRGNGSAFWSFMDLVEFLHERHQTTYGLHQLDLIKSMVSYFVDELKVDPVAVRGAFAHDYGRNVAKEIPHFLIEPEAELVGVLPVSS